MDFYGMIMTSNHIYFTSEISQESQQQPRKFKNVLTNQDLTLLQIKYCNENEKLIEILIWSLNVSANF